jgi:hypothetical protein
MTFVKRQPVIACAICSVASQRAPTRALWQASVSAETIGTTRPYLGSAAGHVTTKELVGD